MDTPELVILLFLLAIVVCLLVLVGLWFRNRRTAGRVILVTWPPWFRARCLVIAVLSIAGPLYMVAATRSFGAALFALFPVFWGTLFFAFLPWRLTERGILSLSGFMTYDRIESFRWWGRGQLTSQLTIYPKRGTSRFSSVTTVVALAQQDAVDTLLRQHARP